MLTPRQVELGNKYSHYSLGIQLENIQACNQILQKTTASNRASVPQKDPSWIFFLAKKVWVASNEIQALSMTVWIILTSFGLLSSCWQFNELWNISGHLTLKILFCQYFWLHEAKGIWWLTARITRWINLKRPLYVKVWLGAIAALNVMSLYNTSYSEMNIDQNILNKLVHNPNVKGRPM